MEAISYLHGQGIETVMLSGDRQDRCEAVAAELGISTVLSEQLPEEKLTHISQFSQEKPTVMVGDGINDAPALARATTGISLGSATEIAMHAAEVILLEGKLDRIVELHQISRYTVKTIRQNLFWAFFYNVLAIPAAAVGYLRPIIAAASMALSDVIVVGNSLRLRFRKLS